jgi:hypothetical protein
MGQFLDGVSIGHIRTSVESVYMGINRLRPLGFYIGSIGLKLRCVYSLYNTVAERRPYLQCRTVAMRRLYWQHWTVTGRHLYRQYGTGAGRCQYSVRW